MSTVQKKHERSIIINVYKKDVSVILRKFYNFKRKTSATVLLEGKNSFDVIFYIFFANQVKLKTNFQSGFKELK